MAAAHHGAGPRGAHELSTPGTVAPLLQQADWPGPGEEGLRRRLGLHRQRLRVPALAAALLHRDGRSMCATDGVLDLTSARRADVDTVFAWYSLSKVLTATVCVRELSRAGLTLDARVVDLAPELVPASSGRQRTYWQAMTVRHLLSHAAGFGDHQFHAAAWFLDPEDAWPEPRAALQDVLASRDWLSRPPGTGFRYTNLGYAVLGEVLAEVTGTPFRHLVIERVLRPVGAQRASFDPPALTGRSANVARGHVRRWSRMGLLTSTLRGFSDGPARGTLGSWVKIKQRRPMFSPHGGLWGPVGDLIPVLLQHLAAGQDPRDPLHDMQRVHRARAGRAQRRGEGGLGWRIHAGPPLRLSHGGRGPGFSAAMEVLPGAGRAVAVLGNATFDASAVVADLLSDPGW